jgi:hypothetical protein
MTRNLKAFGLALVAAMVLGTLGAQGASAVVEHSFRSGAEKFVLTGANESYTTGNSREKATLTSGLTIECDATYEGTNVGTTRDTVTIHPTYHNCTSSFGGGTTLSTNGCNYILDTDTTQLVGHSSSSEHAAVSLECEDSHLIEVLAPGCTIAYNDNHSGTPVNQSLHGVRYTEVTHSSKAAGTVTQTVRTIKYNVTAGSLCGLAGHPAGTYSNASYDGKSTVTGYVDSTVVSGSTTNGTVWSHGAQTDIHVSTPT